MKIKGIVLFLSTLLAFCVLLSACGDNEPDNSNQAEKELTNEQFDSAIAQTRAHFNDSARPLRVVWINTSGGKGDPVERELDFDGNWVRVTTTRDEQAETKYYEQRSDSTYHVYEKIGTAWTLTETNAVLEYTRANIAYMIDLVKAMRPMTAFAGAKYTVKEDRLGDFTLAYFKYALDLTDDEAQDLAEQNRFTSAYFKITGGKISELHMSMKSNESGEDADESTTRISVRYDQIRVVLPEPDETEQGE